MEQMVENGQNRMKAAEAIDVAYSDVSDVLRLFSVQCSLSQVMFS